VGEVGGRSEFEEGSVDHDGDEGGGEGGVVNRGGDDVHGERDLGEDEGEFSDLGEAEADAPRGLSAVAEEADDHEPDEKFSDDDEADQECDELPSGEPGVGVNEHADGDEEERDEDFAEGDGLGGEFVGEGGGAEEHASDESAEGE
jgi:hypothetical protein